MDAKFTYQVHLGISRFRFRPEVADLRRPGRLRVDREHEHGAGREQEVVSHVRRNHRFAAEDQPHL